MRHHEIIGVMPPDFGLPNVQADVYVPLAIRVEEGRNYSVVARLRPGTPIGAAKAEIAGIAAHTAQENVSINAGWSATVVPLLDQTVGAIRPILLVLFAAVGLILLLACANVANLLLMHSAARTTEISIRLALGAGRWRIARQLVVENLVLAVSGGAAGLILASAAVQVLRNRLPETLNIPRLADATLDVPALAFSVGVTLFRLFFSVSHLFFKL